MTIISKLENETKLYKASHDVRAMAIIYRIKNDDTAGNIRVRHRAERNAESLRQGGTMFQFVSISADNTDAGIKRKNIRGNVGRREEISDSGSSISEVFKTSVDLQSDHSDASANSGDNGTKTSDDSDRTAELLQARDETVRSVEKPRKASWAMWHRAVREMDIKQRVVHDVWEIPRNFDRKLFCQSIRNHSGNKICYNIFKLFYAYI